MPKRRTKASSPSPSPGSGRPLARSDFELAFLGALLRLSQERSIASGISLRDVAELLEPRRLVPNYRIYDHLLDALPRLQELHLLVIVEIDGRPRLQLTMDGAHISDLAKEKPTMKDTQQSAKSTTGKASEGFTAEERAAMKQRAQELKAAAGESDVLAKIAEMPESDRVMAERLHAIIKASAPDLSPRTWYGMPAYARDGHVVCFFQSGQKFKTRYATLGFSDKANLDEGAMWPTAFALTELTAADEARIEELVKQAVS